jgi:hypothetical protein
MADSHKHTALYELYESVSSVRGDEDGIKAYDASGNLISYDIDAVDAKAVEIETAEKLQELRTERNRLIAETDHWVLSDTADATSAQITYRQALRDITDSATSLDDVTWPTKP